MLYFKFVVIYIILFSFIFLISKYFNWVDEPNKRKIHSFPIYNTSGLALYLFYAVIISQYEFNHNIELIIATGSFVCLGGFIDDRKNIRPITKLIIIFIPSIYLLNNGISITDIGEYEYIGLINLGKFSIPFLVLAIGLLINATNYVDGVDGLLLGLFITSLVYYLFLVDSIEVQNLLKLLLIPVVINFIFNIIPHKTSIKFFSGDCGSLFIGFFLSFLTINLYKEFNIHPTYLIWPLWYPVYDFLYVSINRLQKNRSLFTPDKTHLHQIIFYRLNQNHILTTFIFLVINIIIILISYYLNNLSKITSLSFFVIGFFIYFFIRKKIKLQL